MRRPRRAEEVVLKKLQQLALQRGAEGASSIAAEEALAPFDPLLRWLVRRRVLRLLRRAERECPLGDPAHTFRLAALMGAGRAVEAPEDEQAVLEAFRELGEPTGAVRRGPWLSASAVVLLGGCVVAGLGWRHATRPFSPRETPAGVLLGDQLPRYVTALVRADDPRVATVRASLAEGAPGAVGEEPARALDAVFRSMEAVRKSQEPAAVDGFRAAVAGLSRALAASGLPYFVDGELLPGKDGLQPLLLSYYVQSEAVARGPEGPVRVVQLWRLDDLNVAHGYLGFTRPHTPAAIVLLDQVEEHLIQVTLPAAAPDGRVELVDARTREKGEAWVFEVEERASVVARAHYASLGEPLASDARRLGARLAERRDLVRKWQSTLRGQGMELVVPRALFPDVKYESELELRVPRVDLRTWESIHDELRERLPSFERLRDLYVAGLERHEVQHRLDYARGLIPVPPLLCRLLDHDNPLDAPVGTLPARARDELSAYLAALAEAGDSPLLELLVLSRFVLDAEQGRTPYTYAAVAVYLALARELGIDIEPLLGRAITRERFARLALPLWQRTPEEIEKAAARAYATEFGAELESVPLTERVAHRRYRP